MADVDGDGRADLIAAAQSNDASVVFILKGLPGGGFGRPVRLASGWPTFIGQELPIDLAVDDFNGDGRPDIAVLNSNGGYYNVTILAGQGDGSFAVSVRHRVPWLPGHMAGGRLQWRRQAGPVAGRIREPGRRPESGHKHLTRPGPGGSLHRYPDARVFGGCDRIHAVHAAGGPGADPSHPGWPSARPRCASAGRQWPLAAPRPPSTCRPGAACPSRWKCRRATAVRARTRSTPRAPWPSPPQPTRQQAAPQPARPAR
ncbi:MAG: hypothetical protein HEQ37_14515 [Acidovorax sp.]|nr:hypothetical protein [Acidovorax sp.]